VGVGDFVDGGVWVNGVCGVGYVGYYSVCRENCWFFGLCVV